MPGRILRGWLGYFGKCPKPPFRCWKVWNSGFPGQTAVCGLEAVEREKCGSAELRKRVWQRSPALFERHQERGPIFTFRPLSTSMNSEMKSVPRF